MGVRFSPLDMHLLRGELSNYLSVGMLGHPLKRRQQLPSLSGALSYLSKGVCCSKGVTRLVGPLQPEQATGIH